MQHSQPKICILCNEPAKYCCPNCTKRTCSLKCVKLHKVKYNCTGTQSKTDFISLNKFGNNELLSDYRFLEDVSRTVDNAGRQHFGGKKYFRDSSNPFLPKNLYKLKCAARHRKTELSLLPQIFTKRQRNTTILRYSEQIIFWRIEWSFSEANVSYTDERIDETIMINACLDKYLMPEHSDLEVQRSLAFYQSCGHKGVAVLLKKDDDPANLTRYFELDKNKSLKKNFQYKRIIEYPTLLVISQHNLHMYDLVTPDNNVPQVLPNLKEEPIVCE